MAASMVQVVLLVMILNPRFIHPGECFFDAITNAFTNAGEALYEMGKETLNACVETASSIIDAAVDENCEFKCPPGAKMVKNKNNEAKPDGCGSFGLTLDGSVLPVKSMTDCCNEHDLCYSECFADKDLCDIKFRKCLYGTCDKHQEIFTDERFKRCKGGAKLLYLGTLALGCKSFLNAQKDACLCELKAKSNQKWKHREL